MFQPLSEEKLNRKLSKQKAKFQNGPSNKFNGQAVETKKLTPKYTSKSPTPKAFDEGASAGLPENLRNILDPEKRFALEGGNIEDLKKEIKDNRDLLNKKTEEQYTDSEFEDEEATETSLTVKDQRKEKFVAIVIEEMEAKGFSISPEEAMSLLDSDFRVEFPFGMFMAATIKDGFDVINSIISLVLSLTGVGLVVSIPMKIFNIFIQILYQAVYFFWLNGYIGKSDGFIQKLSLRRRLIYRYLARRWWAAAIEFIPILGDTVPMNSIMVVMTYNYFKKIANEVEEIVEKAQAESTS